MCFITGEWGTIKPFALGNNNDDVTYFVLTVSGNLYDRNSARSFVKLEAVISGDVFGVLPFKVMIYFVTN